MHQQPRVLTDRALLYNDGGFDVSPDGTKMCACVEFWIEDGVDDKNALIAKEIESIMLPRLKDMQINHPTIGDIRGRGAMIAIELVKPGTMEPDADRAAALNKYCHQHGVVTLTAGTYGNVFRFLPSLVMPRHLLEEAMSVLEEAFEATSA